MGTVQCLDLHQFSESYLQNLRAQDLATEAHFVSYFGRMLHNKLRRHLTCPEHIKDVQQETLLRAWAAVQSEGGVRQPERFGAFVSSVCNNILHELYRSRSRVRPMDDMQIDPKDDAQGPDAVLLAAETKKLVQKVLAHLGQKDRTLLQAVFFEQRDKDEVCRELGVSRNYLRVLLHRAKQQFTTEYERLNASSRKAASQTGKDEPVPAKQATVRT